MIRKISLVILTFLIFSGTRAQPFPKREMRAAWIATVGNIDWPSRSGLPVEEQQREIVRILDRLVEYKFNTVVFQIRPSADAFYSSLLEPWAQWLNGKQGKAPEPFYDPLEYIIKECRKRGLSIHAWLNPYRAITDTSGTTAENHITRIHPEWFLTYGKTVYFDPGLPATRNYFAGIVSDVVRRYDVDAIHMDDYFYPYRIANLSFPDDSSFAKYSGDFSPEKRDDWRRENVNLIIKQLSDSIKSLKPWVEFGISPFGVWRNIEKDPAGSATKAGQTNYDDLFADILLWEKKGWIDYVAPQIYWHIGFKVADYGTLAEWWSRNAYGCMLYVGQAPYRIDKKSVNREWRSSREIARQVEINRSYPTINGSMYFSARVLMKDPEKLEKRLSGKYRYPALVPVNGRIMQIIPHSPVDAVMNTENDMIRFSWKNDGDARRFVVYKFRIGKPADLNNPQNIVAITSDSTLSLKSSGTTRPGKYTYYITSVGLTNSESTAVRFMDAALKVNE
jgi:uncharacterized lipoprotein YddW (UPF0748 family)